VDRGGNPTFKVEPDGTVDWYTYAGFTRYSAECLRCHGPDGLGSTYAPPLADSLKRLSYLEFYSTVASGKKDVSAAQELVMPAEGQNKNVMCYIDAIYVYLRARADGAVERGRPGKHAPKPEAYTKAEDDCMG
jgi:methanol metabolism-related c-type cytochrome